MKHIKPWAMGLFPVRVVVRYLSRSGPNGATMVAWNFLFAFFPIILVAVIVAGEVFRNPSAANSVIQAVARDVPGGKGGVVVQALHSFRRDSGWLAIVGVVGLLWSGSSLFGSMDQTFAAIGGGSSRSFLAQKLMAFAMIVVFAILAVPIVLSSSLLSMVKSVPAIPSAISSGPLAWVIQVVLSVVVGSLLFFLMYRFVPKYRRKVSSVLPGAITAGALLELLTLAFPLYFHLSHGFSTYGSTFSLFFLVLAYAFLLAQITVVGFAVVAEREPIKAGAFATGSTPLMSPPPKESAPPATA